ncbi:putative 2-aminoethylphosphonate ABC transporter permease subunit [Cupriavidus taiwanensis]|uniref:putative 2-aminoethylphosphonate ABC transporter permease subunit n=1 Tax=Cupriavidus taiwanensis TaxID=164546 RepID=UPI0025414DC8|nr:putative 2-aminoethylphosphonate ABC transporter permease subunit [Cupriavidus taiwanensis]MDK3021466.1 putative 2-aminoethylphosphonate ABC transporter permease subunit [Cupriavidus taiwanensis]
MRMSLTAAPAATSATLPATDTLSPTPASAPAGPSQPTQPTQPAPPALVATSVRAHWTDRLAHVLLALAALALACFVLAPIVMILAKSVQNRDGTLAGIAHFRAYFESPALLRSVWNSLWISALATCITVPLAFGFAYALTRSRIACKGLLRNLALIPLLAPSLLAAISFIFWFGNQGLFKPWMGSTQIYGPLGIVASLVFATFPHALMILITALSLTDARLYEAADALGTSTVRKFFTITLPGARYGVVSAAMVVFTYAISDFGIPKVIGGNFHMLATDIYKLVIGMQDFSQGAVVSLMLLVPVAVTYCVDARVQRRQMALMSARSVPYVPRRSPRFDLAMAVFCWVMAALMLAVMGMAVYASFVKLWPYNFSLSLNHYRVGLVEGGVVDSYLNSLRMAGLAAVIGPVFIFATAYLLEKTRGMDWLRSFVRLMAVLPMGVPGLVLGLGYIFFFVPHANPLHGLYQTLGILVLVTIVHYYASCHLTAVTALKQLDAEFEAVSASLKVPFYKTFFRVTVPACLPAILEISRYLFINAMTTVSAVVFLYGADTKLASVEIVNLDESGDIGPAAAMATLVVLTSAFACLLYYLLQRVLDCKTQAWRQGQGND